MTKSIDHGIIKSQIELPDGGKVILLDMLARSGKYAKAEIARNIFRIEEDGAIKWQVHGDFDTEGSPYTRIVLENGLSAYRWDGGTYSIDLETGKATPLRLER
jgi:hypothetical protein